MYQSDNSIVSYSSDEVIGWAGELLTILTNLGGDGDRYTYNYFEIVQQYDTGETDENGTRKLDWKTLYNSSGNEAMPVVYLKSGFETRIHVMYKSEVPVTVEYYKDNELLGEKSLKRLRSKNTILVIRLN